MTAPTTGLAALEDRLHRLASERLQAPPDTRTEVLAPDRHRAQLAALVRELLLAEGQILPVGVEAGLIESVVHRIVGLGPLEPLLSDPEVTEIMDNAPDEVFVERAGRLERVDAAFRDSRHVLHVIDRIISPLGRRVDESVPYVDARLPDGSRVHAIIPPLALRGPALTIRRFPREPFTLRRLVELSTLSDEMARFLAAAVRARLSIVISGGTGSGKTSTLNALARQIPRGERLITIEDTAELQLTADHLVALEARPPNFEGLGEVTIRTLVRNALRMRPNRIIVGECRGAEAFDMLQAMNTGHPGSLTTVHANSPADAVRRLESMVLMADLDLPHAAIREQIASAVRLIVQQDRMPDGTRKVVSIGEVRGEPLGEDGRAGVAVREVFRSELRAGRFAATGDPPECLEAIRAAGVSITDSFE